METIISLNDSPSPGAHKHNVEFGLCGLKWLWKERLDLGSSLFLAHGVLRTKEPSGWKSIPELIQTPLAFSLHLLPLFWMLVKDIVTDNSEELGIYSVTTLPCPERSSILVCVVLPSKSSIIYLPLSCGVGSLICNQICSPVTPVLTLSVYLILASLKNKKQH